MNTPPVITLAEFEAGTIEANAFDHEAHVYMAWLMLDSCELPEAIHRYDAALRQLTSRLGVPEKYHATITWLFLVLINQRRTPDQT